MRRIYLDHNATTPLHPDAKDSMLPFLGTQFGNPSSGHWAGREILPHLDRARGHAAELIGAEPEEITFVSGGTEADNWAIKSVLSDHPGAHIITSAVEHPAVFNVCQELKAKGHELTTVTVDRYGQVSPESVKSSIKDNTALISIMLANNETGTINPIKEIAALAREHNIAMHTDAVQAVGKIPVNVGDLDVDILSASGHKFNGPKGTGFQYVRKGFKLKPFILGGSQENSMRSGTENVPGIVGIGKACEVAHREMSDKEMVIGTLRDMLEEGLRNAVPDTEVNGHPTERIYNTLNISFKYIEGEALLTLLEGEGIAVSTGSACSSGSTEPSRVLKEMHLDPLCSRGAIRFSLGLGTSRGDIEHCLNVIPPMALRLQKMSPFSSS